MYWISPEFPLRIVEGQRSTHTCEQMRNVTRSRSICSRLAATGNFRTFPFPSLIASLLLQYLVYFDRVTYAHFPLAWEGVGIADIPMHKGRLGLKMMSHGSFREGARGALRGSYLLRSCVSFYYLLLSEVSSWFDVQSPGRYHDYLVTFISPCRQNP
jgi:hypothetical protein